MIETTADLAAACKELAKSDFITIDTEFLRETTFWPELCLIQMASPTVEVLVDPLAKDIDLSPFFELMANPDVLKVFHAARQDIEIIFNRGNLIPHPIFDTQVAAMRRSQAAEAGLLRGSGRTEARIQDRVQRCQCRQGGPQDRLYRPPEHPGPRQQEEGRQQGRRLRHAGQASTIETAAARRSEIRRSSRPLAASCE